jgi:hypothetical protein
MPAVFSQNSVLKGEKKYEKENMFPFCSRPDSLFLAGNYQASLQLIKKDTTITRENYLYRLASIYAKMNFIDSAFFYLNEYIKNSWDDRIIFADNTWDVLKEDSIRWQQIVDEIERIYLNELDSTCNKPLALELFYMGILDQKYRVYASCLRQFPVDSIFIADNKKIALNRERFEEILEQYGFPARSAVGKLGSTCAFLMFQHLGYTLVTYYPLIEKCYQDKEISSVWYAMATDRYLMDKNKKQRYGTQFLSGGKKLNKRFPDKTVLWPVEDFKNINQRRKEMGFSTTIEEHVKTIRNGYIPPEYYKGKGNVKWFVFDLGL